MSKLSNIACHGKRVRRLATRFSTAFFHPKLTIKHLKQALRFIHTEKLYAASPIPVTPLSKIISITTPIRLVSCTSQDGNVSYLEILCLASFIANLKPKYILEIGTFDGNSTLQMALNAPKDCQIHTLDLPPEDIETALPLDQCDKKYTGFAKNRKYIGTPVESLITQHLGDSSQVNFLSLSNGKKYDFIFIDGGHSYECVENDTSKALKCLAPGGTILWHDFGGHWIGVYEYLSSLSRKLPLERIEGTTLIRYTSPLI